MRKRILILFPYEWAAYSPTILNLVELLSSQHNVTVISFDNKKYESRSLNPKVFTLIRLPGWILAVLALIGADKAARAFLLVRATRNIKADVVIGVDTIGLYAAQKRFGAAHLLSLEITRDWFLRNAYIPGILSVAIQSRERFDYLFPNGVPVEVFILPNSPIVAEGRAPKVEGRGGRMVFLGNVIPSHGVYLCIEAVKEIPGTTLTIKGTIRPSMRKRLERKYAALFADERLVLDMTYTDQDEIIDYIGNFEIGFCFYDFRYIAAGDVNYITSPSGKMYNYFAAGVPVVGSDIKGLIDIKNFGAGILLKNPSTESILRAVNDLRKNYSDYQEGCVRAAIALDFARCASPYLHFLLESEREK